ncbi:MAG TPA: response regulator [Polyangiaceae bacterium]|nr:response regulator [Polyangiaceae bacterium]
MARFLVVDDDPAAVRALKRLLDLDGHDVSAFTSGAEAIGELSRASFDVVVTDLEMPDTDGRAVMRIVRGCVPRICLVVATARAVDKYDELAEAGACIVADKPLDYDEVTRMVAECRRRASPDGECPIRGARCPLVQLRV